MPPGSAPFVSPSPPDPHPLRHALDEAAEGRHPPVDGAVELTPPDPAGAHAVVEFTGHSFVLTDRSVDDLSGLDVHGFGGATHPDVLRRLAGPTGWIGSLDAFLVRDLVVSSATSTATSYPSMPLGPPLIERIDLDDHPRVVRARQHRRDVVVLGDETGLVTLGRGLVDRLEVSVERFPSDGSPEPASPGTGRSLVLRALPVAAERFGDRWIWAQVAPGNAASLRMFLALGFRPVGSEVLLEPDRV